MVTSQHPASRGGGLGGGYWGLAPREFAHASPHPSRQFPPFPPPKLSRFQGRRSFNPLSVVVWWGKFTSFLCYLFCGSFLGGRNATFCIFNVIFCRRRVRVTQVPKSSSHCCLLLPGSIWSLARLVDSWPVATFIRSSKIFWRSLHFVKLTARPWKKVVLLSLLRRLC